MARRVETSTLQPAVGTSRSLALLLATDGSGDAAVACDAAVDLARRGGWRLHVVHAWQAPIPFPYLGYLTAPDYPREYRERGDSVVTEGRRRIEEHGGNVGSAQLVEGRPAEAILQVADSVGAGLVIVGSRGLGRLQRLALGTVSEEVLHHSRRPVLVVRGGADAWPPSHIVAADDGSAIAAEAARLAGVLAATLEVPLVLVQVLPHISDRDIAAPGMSIDAALAAAETQLGGRAEQIADATGASMRARVAVGSPAEALLDCCQADGDRPMLACGSRGNGLIQRMRLGSVSRHLLHASHLPILVVPGGSNGA
jgi:nucleotide-binding universal stress UspA family protein